MPTDWDIFGYQGLRHITSMVGGCNGIGIDRADSTLRSTSAFMQRTSPVGDRIASGEGLPRGDYEIFSELRQPRDALIMIPAHNITCDSPPGLIWAFEREFFENARVYHLMEVTRASPRVRG